MSYFVRMIKDKQLVGFYSGDVSPRKLPCWADEVIDPTWCEVTFLSPWGINWTGAAPKIGEPNEDEEHVLISEGVFTLQTHSDLADARWWPVASVEGFCYFVEMGGRIKIGHTLPDTVCKITNIHKLSSCSSVSPNFHSFGSSFHRIVNFSNNCGNKMR